MSAFRKGKNTHPGYRPSAETRAKTSATLIMRAKQLREAAEASQLVLPLHSHS
jgi:hypothetical protein